jgi:hypothetical protein
VAVTEGAYKHAASTVVDLGMVTKTVRSRSRFEIGQKVENCTILAKSVIIPPDPIERRLGVYEYVVEAPVALPVVKVKANAKSKPARKTASIPEPSSFTRSTPDEMGSVIRRLPSR